jgi:hypothetical protein
MSNLPNFNDQFHEYYDQYSIPESELKIPFYFNRYAPDNQDDYNCVLVISPNVNKGSKIWTINGKVITIGIYRDEGRMPQIRPIRQNVSWARIGTKIIVADTKKHNLAVGDSVDIWNMNIPFYGDVKVTEILSESSFAFRGAVIGSEVGNAGAYQSKKVINFFETHRVFRLLPSFKLITIDQLNKIFKDAEPDKSTAKNIFFDITKWKEVIVPNTKSTETNYNLPLNTITKDSLLSLSKRFDQVLDESGEPLKIDYQDNGRALVKRNVDSSYSNMQVFKKSAMLNEGNDEAKNSKIYAYDFYGIDLNDSSRGPYFSDKIVIRNEKIEGDIGNLLVKNDNEEKPIYSGKIHDEYGNLAIGVQENNSLVIRKQILPLKLDLFNRPLKKPLR